MLTNAFNRIEPPWYGPVCLVVWEGGSCEAPPYPDWYFNPEDRPLTTNGLWQIVKRAARKAGLDDVKPHDFRRYVATQVAERHGLRAAQRVLGHAVLMTTEKYYILDGELPGGMTEDLF